MRARTPAAAAIAAALSLSLAACSDGDTAGGSSQAGSSVGISMPTKTSQRWINDGNNMVDELKQYGYTTTLTYANDSSKTQIAQLEKMIKDGVDTLVIASVDSTVMGSVLKKAEDANVPVIAYDRLPMNTSDVDYYSSFDNLEVGELQALYIVERLGLVNGTGKGPFNIELFAGSADDNNAKYFFEGAMSVLKEYIDNNQLVVKSGQTDFKNITTLRWNGKRAETRMAKLLSTTYADSEVDAVLSPYDGMSIGILDALKADGYGSAGKKLPIITGQDAETPSVKAIIEGQQSETVYKDTRKLALVTAHMVNSVLHGSAPVISDTKTYDNGKKVVPAYLLDPVSVDKTNYEEVLVNSGYIKADDLK